MDLRNHESQIRFYIHRGALLKHVADVTRLVPDRSGSESFVRLLIAATSLSQAEKWRKYAESENDRRNCPSRVELS
jgi:hypothetical protein